MAKSIIIASLIATAFIGTAATGVNAAATANEAPPSAAARHRAGRRERGEKRLNALRSDIEAIKRTALKPDGTSKIEHVVVAMLENRAFDHMLGWMGEWGVPVDGLTGAESNMITRDDGSTFEAFVNGDCPYINPFDPLHDLNNVTNAVMDGARWVNPSPMSGFAQSHYLQGFKTPENVMHGFKPERVPAISTLAKHFAVFDKYFSSVPGPTFPNRLYMQSGTSHGMTVTSNLTILIPGAPQTSVFDVLRANNMTWRTYFEDFPDALVMRNQRTWEDITTNVRWFDDFADDCKKGDMADYTWVSPRFYAFFGKPARDQHPDHDVALGEDFLKQLYEGVRNSPKWEKTLLIVTYDEHGGFYDHVPPPQTQVPNPDGIIGGQGTVNEFNFTRLGVRVPFIAISPYIKKQVVSWPRDAPAKQFEHSSLFATLKRMYGFPEELTKRTAFAAPFDFLLEELDEPRTDCPTTIPVPQPKLGGLASLAAYSIKEAAQEVNDLQHEMWHILASTVKDLELGENGEQLKFSAAKIATLERFSKILLPTESSSSRLAGVINAVRRDPAAANVFTTSASPLLHERMQKASFPTQGDMAGVVLQIMEALVPRRK